MMKMDDRKLIGDYRLIDQLGHGGAGEVFLATPTREKRFASPGELVAIKCYNERVLSASNQLDRIRREFQIGSKLVNPYLVRMHEINLQDAKNPFLVMEYVDGVPLNHWIRLFHPVSSSLLLRTLTRIAQAIQALHEARTVHRDIKPENIMLSSDFVPKLMDFGVVRIEHVDGKTPSHSFIGTIRNAAPEWLRREEKRDDLRTDLYSFGTVIYAMLHGYQVFHEERQFACLVDLVTHKKPVFDEALKGRGEPFQALFKLGERLLEKNVDDRPQTIDEVLDILKTESNRASSVTCQPLHGYMASALTGVPEDAHEAIAFKSRHIAEVCKEFNIYVYQPRLENDPLLNPDVEAEVVYERDRKRIITADVLIVGADHPSFGVGQEIEIAAAFGVPTIVIRKENAKTKLSRMVTGSSLNLIGEVTYSTPEDLSDKLRTLVGENLEKIRSFKDSIRPQISQHIGARLGEIRREAGLSLNEAAKAIGTSPRLLKALEERPLNYHNLGLHILGRLLIAYGTTIEAVFGPAPSVPTVRPRTIDQNIRALEEVSRTAGWSTSDYLELRDDYERQLAASGDPERVDQDRWLQRHAALEKRRIQDRRAKQSPESREDLFS
jgi:serine/threonine protein kinase/transcriptional regulator with XRE-family HTH domain